MHAEGPLEIRPGHRRRHRSDHSRRQHHRFRSVYRNCADSECRQQFDARLVKTRARDAVSKRAVACDIRPKTVVQRRLRRVEGRERIDDGGQRLVIDVDELKSVFRAIAVGCDDDGDGFPDVAHPIDGDRPALNRRLDTHHKARAEGGHIDRGDDTHDARRIARRVSVEGSQMGVGVGRPKDRGVQGSRPQAEVVDIAPTTGQERGIFHSFDRLAQPVGCCSAHRALPAVRALERAAKPWRIWHECRKLSQSGVAGHITRSCDLPRSLILTVNGRSDTRNLAKLARTDAGVVAKEAGEMARRTEPELLAQRREAALSWRTAVTDSSSRSELRETCGGILVEMSHKRKKWARESPAVRASSSAS